jgi:peptidoglycan/xylan/chitin deacetylase (PgdA/CDA1 family)
MSFFTRRVSIAAKLVREIGGPLRTKPARIDWRGGVVSFTFDDFPRSAWTNGGAVLEARDLRGTYYAAMGLAGTDGKLGPMFAVDDLRAAHAHGHEVACHTFSHRDCGAAQPAEMAAEVAANAAALAVALEAAEIENFAYPFGGVSLAAKRALHGCFASCRGTGRGLNYGTVDLADLLSISVYARDFNREKLCQLIDDAQAFNGWAIFYTHDVCDTPTPFGCTPAQLASIVAYAAENATVLPVREVLQGLGLARPASASQTRAA